MDGLGFPLFPVIDIIQIRQANSIPSINSEPGDIHLETSHGTEITILKGIPAIIEERNIVVDENSVLRTQLERQEFIRFNTLPDGQGAVMARPFFEKLLQKIESDNLLGFGKNSVFMKPEEEMIEIDCSKYETTTIENNEEGKIKKSSDFDEDF